MMSDIPETVQLVETTLRCRECGLVFVCRTSEDNLLVKFVDESGKEEAWLPTFEEGGYLEVVERCLSVWNIRSEATSHNWLHSSRRCGMEVCTISKRIELRDQIVAAANSN